MAVLGHDQPYVTDPGARFRTLHHGHPGRIIDVTEDAAVIRWFLFEDTLMRVPFRGDDTDPAARVFDLITDIGEPDMARREKRIAGTGPQQRMRPTQP